MDFFHTRCNLIALLLLVFLAVSCGDETGEGKKEMNVQEFFNRYLTTLCDSAMLCEEGYVSSANRSDCPRVFTTLNINAEYFYSGEVTSFTQKRTLLMNAADNDWLWIDRDLGETCLQTIEQLAPCNPLEVSLFEISTCKKAFRGEKFSGDTCYQDEECSEGWCDLADRETCPGECVRYKTENEQCNPVFDKCAPGFICMETTGCTAKSNSVEGEPCETDAHCADYLYCRKVNEGDSTGKCLVRKEAGKGCSEDKECRIGLSCVEKVCSGDRIGKNVGDDCSGKNHCNYFSKLECNETTEACRNFGDTELASCFHYCDSSTVRLYCDTSTNACKIQESAGRECTANEGCQTFFCNENNVCVMPECLLVDSVDETDDETTDDYEETADETEIPDADTV